MTPIALFVFNRPVHTQQTLEALGRNVGIENVPLYIFSDGARRTDDEKAVDEVRRICREARGFQSVVLIERTENFGLAKNIVEGITSLFTQYSSVIVLEDDLTTSPGFVPYMLSALERYKDEPIWSICGYCPPIVIPTDYPYSAYLTHRNGSWGWATWKDRWELVDWELTDFENQFRSKKWRQRFSLAGNDLPAMLLKQFTKKINSWSIRFCVAGFQQKMPTVYPVRSLISNQGVDGSGTHMKASSKYSVEAAPFIDTHAFCPSNTFDRRIQKSFKRFYDTSLYRQAINKIKTWKFIATKTTTAITTSTEG